MSVKRVGILTGGGDVPGLNSVIKSVVYRGSEIGYQVIGIRRGWEGLTHVNLEDPASRTRYILPLDRGDTRPRRIQGDRHPENHGQRRAEYRVLHRVFDGDHARDGSHWAPAHDGRLT